jgi:tRNA(Ile)-lysidine synthase
LPAPDPTPRGGVDLNRRFADEMGALLGPDFPRALGLAVSGGGDSMAMLHLAAPWARVMGLDLRVATVDHRLRPESGAEAAMVARACADLGLPHTILTWDGWDGQGNLQAAARAARHDLLNRWRGDLRHILFGHTLDDQAETVLMRLARGSGVEGLAGMAACQGMSGHGPLASGDRAEPDWQVLRPLLGTTRAELRHYAKVLHIPYVDDPSNDDDRFDRVKARHALTALAPLGLTAQTLAETANRMARAKTALDARARDAASCVLASRYDVQFDRSGFDALERDTQLRLLARALQSVATNPYRPRAMALDALLDRVLGGGDGVLHGGQVLVRRDRIWVIREAKALQGGEVAMGSVWDGRFVCTGPGMAGYTVRALGDDGIAQLPARPDDLPRAALAVTPAVFDGTRLIACQRLGYGPSYVEDHHPQPVMFRPNS